MSGKVMSGSAAFAYTKRFRVLYDGSGGAGSHDGLQGDDGNVSGKPCPRGLYGIYCVVSHGLSMDFTHTNTFNIIDVENPLISPLLGTLADAVTLQNLTYFYGVNIC